MLSQEENELITQTGPGTAGGDFMRRYWHPVALSEELPPDEPLPVKIMPFESPIRIRPMNVELPRRTGVSRSE